MNPLTNVRNLTKLNERELSLGISGDIGKSWHQKYKDSAWIFFGGIPYDLTEGDLIAVFSQYGEVVNINLLRDHKTGKSRGFGFLCYEDQRSTILAVDNFNGIKLLGRVIRVDHVEEYKVPKLKDDIDEATKKLWEEGCAPKPLEAPAESDEEIMHLDDLPEIKTEPVVEADTGRMKLKKEKKKKEKKHKKKHKRHKSSSSSDPERKRKKRKPGVSSASSLLIHPEDIKRERASLEKQVPESSKRNSDEKFSFSRFTNEKYDEDRTFYVQKKEAEKYVLERYGKKKEPSHYDQAERDFVKRYEEAERLKNKEPEKQKRPKDDIYLPKRYK